MKLLRFLLLVAVVWAAGCQAPTLPNPNDPLDVGNLSADNLEGQMKQIDEQLFVRMGKGEITDDQRKAIERQAAIDLTRGFDPTKMDPLKAYVYGRYLITAEKYSEAKTVLKAAVEQAKASKNEDRRVNDSLDLSWVEARMGEVDEAIKTARTVFNVAPEGAVPILYAVSEKIVPAARGKGKDLELAKLLTDALEIDKRALVDPHLIAGLRYINTRRRKVPEAWDQIFALYNDAKRPDLAAQAAKDRDAAIAAIDADPTGKAHDFYKIKGIKPPPYKPV